MIMLVFVFHSQNIWVISSARLLHFVNQRLTVMSISDETPQPFVFGCFKNGFTGCGRLRSQPLIHRSQADCYCSRMYLFKLQMC